MSERSFIVTPDYDFGSVERLGHCYAGPAAVGFLEWAAIQAQQDRIDHLLFLSPNTSLPERLAKQTDLPARCSCLHGSRYSFMLAAIDETNFLDHLDFLLTDSSGTTPAGLLERIGVTPPAGYVLDDLELGAACVIDDKNKRRVAGLLRALRPDILRVCYRTRRGLLRHLVDLGVQPDMRVALLDIGWNGAVQSVFEHAVRSLVNLDVFGYYLSLDETPDCLARRAAGKMKSLVGVHSVETDLLRRFHANRAVAEFLFSAPDGPSLNYGGWPGDGEPILEGAVTFATTRTERQEPLEMVRPLVEFVANTQYRG